MKPCLLVVCLAISLLGCGDRITALDSSESLLDLGRDDLPFQSEAGDPVRAGFTITGCETLDFSAGAPHCTGRAPLHLTFIPLTAGATTFVWTFHGATANSSMETSPTVDFLALGTFAVTLAVGGPTGSASASGQVVATTGALGQPCLRTSDCDSTSGLVCICGEGSSCPAPLEGGLCTRSCTGGSCGARAQCADFGRGGGAESYRQPLCVPTCANDLECRPGFLCRLLPVLKAGAASGGAYQFEPGCFPPALLGDDGDSCANGSGAPDDTRCLSGRCDPFGARGLCTSDCSDGSCPSGTACVIMNQSREKLCLRRCGGSSVCDDPLLACEVPGAGGLGFSAPTGEPAGTTYCAPRRCTSSADCGPSGACTALDGVSFCIKN